MRLSSSLFFLILLVSTSGILLAAADFGESSDSLGQITDEFDTLDNVSVRVLIERNATLNAMELNFSTSIPFENFTTYTETDPQNKITVYDYNITYAVYERDDPGRVVYDYGAGSISDGWEYEFEINVTALDAGDVDIRNIGTFITLQQTDQAGLSQDEIGFQFRQRGGDDTIWGSQWLQYDEGVYTYQLGVVDYNVSQQYYVRMNRTGNTKILAVYFDSLRTNLVEALTINVGNDDYRFVCLQRVISNVNDGTDDHSGYLRNLHNTSILGVGYSDAGYFSTTDQLASLNGSVLVQLTNATIPAGTTLSVSFSSDNSTWINQTALTNGFMSIDLRTLNWTSSYFLNYTFTGTLTSTPRLYQSRLITTEGALGAGQNVTGEWIDYNLTQINVTVGTHDAGFLNSTFFVDGDTWNCSEIVGAPGYIVSFEWSGIPDNARCLWLTAYVYYDGTNNHDIHIQLYNFSAPGWVTLGHIYDGIGFEWYNVSVYGLRIPNDFVNSTGAVLGRFYHVSAGNINDDIVIDYLRLEANIPSDVTPSVAGDVDIAPWIAIAIILSCIAYLLARSK